MTRAARIIVGVLVAFGATAAASACSSDGTDPPPGGGDGGGGGDTGTGGNDGATGDGGTGAEGGTDGGTDGTTPVEGGSGVSCTGLAATCGGSNDCCAANLVQGDTFNRSNDPTYPATVSDFKLDVYEVTVGRFRKFVEAGLGTQASPPAAGAGVHPKIAASGWDATFNASLEANTAALKAALACDARPVWTDAPGGNENRPISCVTWFEAFAFCAWDGGRLPTEAEWNFAAAGGKDQRDYPWGPTIDTTRASYDCRGDNSAAGQCALTDILAVGSKSPAGDGRYGQKDLGGNVWEWTLDWFVDNYRLTSCVDCADLQKPASGYRAFRGGGYPNESFYLTTATRIGDVATDRDDDVGFRCARSP